MRQLNANDLDLAISDVNTTLDCLFPFSDVLSSGQPQGVLPDHPSLRALIAALMSAGPGAAATGWRQGEACAEIVQHVGLEWVQLRLHDHSEAAAWREVCAVSPLVLDVLCVLVDRLLVADSGVVLLHAADVLAAKGCRRCGEERNALLQQVAAELVRLGQISLGAAETPLFSVAPVLGDNFQFVVGLDPDAKARWMEAPRRPLNWRIVEFDHRRNRGADLLAKKMGLYFSLAGAGPRPTMRSVRNILKGVGALAEALSPGRAGRLADRFDEATLRLQEHHLFTVAYGGRGASSWSADRTKGWMKAWLEATLVIQPFAPLEALSWKPPIRDYLA